MTDDSFVSIRNLQHYLYCPHRWGLINIDCSWAENYFVTKADLMHQRVHDPDHSYVSSKKRVLTAVPVYNDAFGIYGITDCIELVRDAQGAAVEGYPGKYSLTIVEYKPRQPAKSDFNHEDAIQVFAQKICVDSIFRCKSRGVIYYGDTRRRIELPLNENYQNYFSELRDLVSQVRDDTIKGIIPHIRKGQKCGGCSFKDMCLPQLSKGGKKQTFLDYLKQAEQAEDTK